MACKLFNPCRDDDLRLKFVVSRFQDVQYYYHLEITPFNVHTLSCKLNIHLSMYIMYTLVYLFSVNSDGNSIYSVYNVYNYTLSHFSIPIHFRLPATYEWKFKLRTQPYVLFLHIFFITYICEP